jgi:hypothetical protein
MLITPTQSNIQQALRSFLLAVLPAGVEVVAGQYNRVPEPRVGSFVVITPIRIKRLATNLDTFADVVFQGSVAGTVLTVTNMLHGSIRTGLELFGENVTAGTTIDAQLTGPAGGAGTYTVSASQTVAAAKLAAGYGSRQQNAEWTMQLDFHSADTTAGDKAQIVSTMLRDDFGTEFFRNLAAPMNGVSPLHADDPQQRPFINEAQQYEWRWSLDACLQANQVVISPQQFAEALEVGLIEVDSHYPPTA